MSSFSNRLLILFGGLAGVAVGTSALLAVVEYKPWGVPDSRREEYEELVAKIDRAAETREQYANRSRPIAFAQGPIHDAGLQLPGSTGSHTFQIRNDGSEPLKLNVQDPASSLQVSLEPGEVDAGQTANVNVSWTNKGEGTDFQHLVTITTNDPLTPSIELKVVGKLRAKLIVPETVALADADPAVQTSGSFVVYSQVWNGFEVTDAKSDLANFQWHAEPMSANDPELAGVDATSAWRVRVWTTAMEYGRFAGNLTLKIQPNDATEETRALTLNGRVRPPIVFYSRDIHMADGLDMGTMFSGKEHQFHMLVRVRGEVDRRIEVLDVQPKELKAELVPQSSPGNYRLTVTVPADCPLVVFNLPSKHGYVEVGDPDDKQFRNWIPLHGAVVPTSN
jgi:hypothetical protein